MGGHSCRRQAPPAAVPPPLRMRAHLGPTRRKVAAAAAQQAGGGNVCKREVQRCAQQRCAGGDPHPAGVSGGGGHGRLPGARLGGRLAGQWPGRAAAECRCEGGVRRWTEVPPWQRLERGLWERAGPQGSRTGTHSSSPAAVGSPYSVPGRGALGPQSACCLPGACPKHPLQQVKPSFVYQLQVPPAFVPTH